MSNFQRPNIPVFHRSIMKIAIASSGLGHVQRGIEAWALALAEGLAGKGEAVTLFRGGRPEVRSQRSEARNQNSEYGNPHLNRSLPRQPTAGRQRADDGREEPFIIRTLPCLKRENPWVRLWARLAPPFLWRRGQKSAYEIEQRSFAKALIGVLREEPFDVVHTQDVEVAAALEAARGEEIISAPTILAHGTDEPLESLARFKFLQHLSPDHEVKARAVLGDRCRHFCIPNFVHTGFFSPSSDPRTLNPEPWSSLPSDAVVIGCSAALKRGHKRIDILIRETARLAEREPKVFLLLAGAETDETPGLEALARETLGSRCRIMKNLPFEAMPEFYRSLDVYVHSAPEEFFGICLIEAMACGVPVAAHASPTLDWIVGDGGWSVDVARPGFLAEAWDRMMAERAEKKTRARARVEKAFSWDAVYPKFMEMYREVAWGGEGK